MAKEINYIIGWCRHSNKDLCKNWDGKGSTPQVLGDEIVCPVEPDKFAECPFRCIPKKAGIK
jgi:hypothetical protein